MIDTKNYDPSHDYEEDAFEIFDPIIDEVNDILDTKQVPAGCHHTNSYLYYLATKYDKLDPATFRHLPEVEEACQLLQERFDQISEEQNQIVLWHTKQTMRRHSSAAAQFACLYDRWLTSLIKWKEEFEEEGQLLSALAAQQQSRIKS